MTIEQLKELLPPEDVEYLREKELFDKVRVSRVGGEVHIVFENYPIPFDKYNVASAEVLIRLTPPYPNSNPDMFWTLPQIKLKNGSFPYKADVMQIPVPGGHEASYNNVLWQRWSRHYHDQNQWRPGLDGLRTYMTSIKQDIEKGR